MSIFGFWYGVGIIQLFIYLLTSTYPKATNTVGYRKYSNKVKY